MWHLVYADNEIVYFKTEGFEVFITIAFQVIYLLVTYLVVLLLNQHLVNEITSQEKKMSIAFHAVPYAIMITRVNDGEIVDVNTGFERISHYTKAEVIGKSTLEFKLWALEHERSLLVQQLQKDGQVSNMEFQFRKKTSELITGLISCIFVTVENEQCILSVINDISQTKKSELEIRKSRNILKTLVFNLQSEHQQERLNLAAQIDNHLNQSLAALRINMGVLKKKLISEQSVASTELISLADETYLQIGSTIQHSMSLMGQLRNEVLYLLGIEEAINYYVEDIEKNTGIVCRFNNKKLGIQLTQKSSAVIFNIIQDVFGKIIAKGQASFIDINLDCTKDSILFHIIENGNSFMDDSIDLNSSQSGIQIIREKVYLLNGVIHLNNIDSSQSSLHIEIPLNGSLSA